MGLFDLFKFSYNHNYNNVENKNLRAIAPRFRGSKEDTVFVSTSRLCPECSKYNGRIFSLFGKYKAFPVLPHFLTKSRCPLCNCCISYSHYFPGITGNLQQDILKNKKPICDNRTNEEQTLWNQRILDLQHNTKMEKDYEWITQNIPELAPKTSGGYKRMCKSNSANYQKIVNEALKMNYKI